MNLFKNFYLFILGCAGSLWPHTGFLWLWQVGTTLVVVSRGGGVPCRGAQALECRLSSCDTWVSYPKARGIFPGQGLNPCPLHLHMDS